MFNHSVLMGQESPHKEERPQASTGPTSPSPGNVDDFYCPLPTNMSTIFEEAVSTAHTRERTPAIASLISLTHGAAGIPSCLSPPRSYTPSPSLSPPPTTGLNLYSLLPTPGGHKSADKAVSAEATEDVGTQTADVCTAGDRILQTPITGSPDAGSSATEAPDSAVGTCFPRSTVLISSPNQSSVPSPTGDEASPLGPRSAIVAPRPVCHVTLGSIDHPLVEARPSVSRRSLIAPELGPVSISLPPRSPIPRSDACPPCIVRSLSPDSFMEPATPPSSLVHGDTGLTVESRKPQAHQVHELSGTSLYDPHLSAKTLFTASESSYTSLLTPSEPTALSPAPPSSPVSSPVALAQTDGEHRPEIGGRRRGYYFSYYKETIVPENGYITQHGKRYVAVTVGYRVGVFYDRDHAAPYIDGCPGAQYEEHDTYLAALTMYRRARRGKGVQVVEKTVL